MTTLNTIYEYGEKFGILTDKYFKQINTYAINYFSGIDYNNIYLYLIVFLIYLSLLFTKINYMTKTDDTIRKNINDDEDLDPISILFVCSYFIVIIKRFFSNYDISLYRSLIIMLTIYSFYKNINRRNPDISNEDLNIFGDNNKLILIINVIIGVLYLFLYIPLLMSYGDVPDFFYIGFVGLTSFLYLISPVTRNNYVKLIKNQSFSLGIFVLSSALFKNISKYNSRTINVMHIILLISILLIYISTNNLLTNDIKFISDFLPLQKSTIDNLINYDSVSYIYINSSDKDCSNFTSSKYSCDNNYDYYNIRKNRINNNNIVNSNMFNRLYEFTGSFSTFIISQLIAMAIQYIFIFVILIRLPNPSKLYLKFFAYMFIVNITVFYLNTLIKEYNLFNMRNLLYGNSNICAVVDSNNSNLNKTYGVIYANNKYNCINTNLDNDNKSTNWIDLYNYIDYPNINNSDNTKYIINVDDKIKNINYVGLFTTIYGVLYFLLVYTCDYLAFWNKIEPLKVVPYLVLLIIMIIYIIVYNNKTSYIDNIKNNKYDDSNKLSDNNFFNKDMFNKLKNDYNIKEILNNILAITIINTIIFTTHKFYD